MNAPAFQFYAGDFIAGTCDLTQAEVGAYIRLLCYQWNRGSVPVHPDKQSLVAGGPVSDDVAAKFPVGADGLRRNVRMEEERQKQADYRDKQRAKGVKSGEARRTTVEPRLNHGSVPVGTGSEPEGNSPSPSPSPKEKSKTPTPKTSFQKPSLEEVKAFCSEIGVKESDADWFFHKCEGNGWKNGGNPIKDWKATIRSWRSGGYLPSQKAGAQNQVGFNRPGQPDSLSKRIAAGPGALGYIPITMSDCE